MTSGIDPVKVANIQVHSSSTANNSDLIGDIVNGDDERSVERLGLTNKTFVDVCRNSIFCITLF